MTVEGADPITNAGVSNWEAEALASADPLPPSLVSRQTRRCDPACALPSFQNQRALDILGPVCFQVRSEIRTVESQFTFRVGATFDFFCETCRCGRCKCCLFLK